MVCRIHSSSKNLTSLSEFSLDTNNANAVAQELKDILKAYERNTSDLSKSLESVIYKYRKNALNISRSIKEKHSQLLEVMSFDQQQIREYERISQDYKRERAAMLRQADHINKRTHDEISKEGAEMGHLMGSSIAQINSIKPKVDEIKNDLGNLAELNTNIVSLRDDIAELVKQRDDTVSELKKLQQAVKSTGPSKKITDTANDMQNTITSLRSRMNKAKDDLSSLGKKGK